MKITTNTIDCASCSSHLLSIQRLSVRYKWRNLSLLLGLRSWKNDCLGLPDGYDVWLRLKSLVADLKLVIHLKESILFPLILSVAIASDDDKDYSSDGQGDGGPDDDCGIDSIVIVAIGVVLIAVGVPLGAVAVVVTAFVGAVLVVAV